MDCGDSGAVRTLPKAALSAPLSGERFAMTRFGKPHAYL